MSVYSRERKFAISFRERLVWDCLTIPSYCLAFKLFSLLEVIIILWMDTSKLKRSVKLPYFVKMFFEV